MKNFLRGSWFAATDTYAPFTNVSVGSAKNIWATNKAGVVYTAVGGNNFWKQVGNVPLSWVSVAEDGTVWGVDSATSIFRYDTDSWTKISDGLTQISCGSATNVWGVNSVGGIYRWTGGSTWQQIPGTLASVSVASDGTVWGIGHDWAAYRYDGENWTKITDYFQYISCGSATSVWGIDAGGGAQFWCGEGEGWQPMDFNEFTNISVGADGSVWGVAKDGNAYYFVSDKPLLVTGNIMLAPGNMRPTESVDYLINIYNVTPDLVARDITLTPVFDETLFAHNGITITGIPLTVDFLPPGHSVGRKFTITTDNTQAGSYVFYGVNAEYTLVSTGNRINVAGEGGRMDFQVDPD